MSGIWSRHFDHWQIAFWYAEARAHNGQTKWTVRKEDGEWVARLADSQQG